MSSGRIKCNFFLEIYTNFYSGFLQLALLTIEYTHLAKETAGSEKKAILGRIYSIFMHLDGPTEPVPAQSESPINSMTYKMP